jgi:hypothetical protein
MTGSNLVLAELQRLTPLVRSYRQRGIGDIEVTIRLADGHLLTVQWPQGQAVIVTQPEQGD